MVSAPRETNSQRNTLYLLPIPSRRAQVHRSRMRVQPPRSPFPPNISYLAVKPCVDTFELMVLLFILMQSVCRGNVHRTVRHLLLEHVSGLLPNFSPFFSILHDGRTTGAPQPLFFLIRGTGTAIGATINKGKGIDRYKLCTAHCCFDHCRPIIPIIPQYTAQTLKCQHRRSRSRLGTGESGVLRVMGPQTGVQARDSSSLMTNNWFSHR